ncbi:unnamed protein product, partial [Didymodactylos carnosus]
ESGEHPDLHLDRTKRLSPQSLEEYASSLVKNSATKLQDLHKNETLVKLVFDKFKLKHGRRYHNSSEEHRRRQIFGQRMAHVLNVNSKNLSHKLGLNHFSDLTEQEFNRQKKGLIPDHKKRTRKPRSVFMQYVIHSAKVKSQTKSKHKSVTKAPPAKGVTASTTLDWVAKGRVTSPTNQLSCGDCYAFATTAVVEGLLAKKTAKLVSLSPQEITDCSQSYQLQYYGQESGAGGCGGGGFVPSIQYLNSNGGRQARWNDYPYVGDQQGCRASAVSRQTIGANIKYTAVKEGDEAALLQAVTRGPVFLAINANTQTFMSYASGVINLSAQDCPNSPYSLDHAVTLVGYGYDSTTKLNYWKVKNSWSTSWGEGGYFRIARGTKNVCGVASGAWEGTL